MLRYYASSFEVVEDSGFSKDICRSMVAMLDADQSGKLGLEEFQKLLTSIAKWKAIFKQHDKDDSGKLNAFELSEALEATGYKLSKRVLNALTHRYSSRDGQIAFDDFIMCAVKINTMMGTTHMFILFCFVVYIRKLLIQIVFQI